MLYCDTCYGSLLFVSAREWILIGKCLINVVCTLFRYQNYQRNLRERQAGDIQQQPQPVIVDEVPREPEPEAVDEIDNSDNAQVNSDSDSRSAPVTDATTTESTSSSNATTPELEENNRLPTVTLLRTFVLSFFASLIPETPAV